MSTGRRKGGESRGYWFRKGRGWYATHGDKKIPLRDADGVHIKDSAAKTKARQAYIAWASTVKHEVADAANPTVKYICDIYLEAIAATKSENTRKIRSRYLFDFCAGVPLRYLDDPAQCPRNQRLHAGYGHLRVSDISLQTVAEWLAAHKRWVGSRGMATASVAAAFNYAKKHKLIPDSPLRGVHIGPYGRRDAYWSHEEEKAVMAALTPAARMAVNACLRTGCRPGEMAKLEARHVKEVNGRQEWRLGLTHKTGYRGNARTVHVPKDIANVVRELVKKYPEGPLFRTGHRKGWTANTQGQTFQRLRKKLADRGVTLTKDQACWYCARHTFAKRVLGGEWGQPPQTIEIVAGLMGNSRDTCWRHYGQWSSQYTDPLWRAIGE